ncbi:MAG TPA: hypothetical protein VMR23_02405 [Candidatus Limnocylindria bacterium]|nr:hypothetical protein [Candidatus Limnocylindria bacterium]
MYTMRSTLLALGLTLLVLAAPLSAPGAAPVPRLVINPGSGAGDITARSSEAQIIKRFGRRNVLKTRVPIGQGQEEPGTIVFPRDPRRTIAILWKRQSARVSPKHARVRGDDGAWIVGPGVRLGLTLQELEALNGGPFILTGFGDDYEGTVVSWDRGTLDRALGATSRVAVRLAPSPADREAAAAFSGNQEFRSEALRDVNLRVYEIAIDFD